MKNKIKHFGLLMIAALAVSCSTDDAPAQIAKPVIQEPTIETCDCFTQVTDYNQQGQIVSQGSKNRTRGKGAQCGTRFEITLPQDNMFIRRVLLTDCTQ